LDRGDFWVIFRPKGLEKVDQIVEMKKAKNILPKIAEINFRAKQLIFSVL